MEVTYIWWIYVYDCKNLLFAREFRSLWRPKRNMTFTAWLTRPCSVSLTKSRLIPEFHTTVMLPAKGASIEGVCRVIRCTDEAGGLVWPTAAGTQLTANSKSMIILRLYDLLRYFRNIITTVRWPISFRCFAIPLHTVLIIEMLTFGAVWNAVTTFFRLPQRWYGILRHSTASNAQWDLYISLLSFINSFLPYFCCCVFRILYALLTVWCLILALMFIFRATVSAVSCLVVPAFICIDLLFSCALKLNDDDDDVCTVPFIGYPLHFHIIRTKLA